MRMLLVTAVVVFAALAGCGGDESSYDADDVRQAFASVGLKLQVEKLDDDPCEWPSTVTGVDPDSVGCASDFVPLEGEDANAEWRKGLPDVQLWNVRERRYWNVWIYPKDITESQLADMQASWLGLVRLDARLLHEGNVVVFYIRPKDEARLRAALEQL